MIGLVKIKVEVALIKSILSDVPDAGEGSGKEEAPKGGKPGFPTWACGEQPYDCHPDGWRATEEETGNECVYDSGLTMRRRSCFFDSLFWILVY